MPGYVIDSSVLIALAKSPRGPLRDLLLELQSHGTKLVTIRAVCAECFDVPWTLLQEVGIWVECTEQPIGNARQMALLDAFQFGHGRRADKAIFAHAIARTMDILTMDWNMRNRSFKEFLKRMDRFGDSQLPLWHIPEIRIVSSVRYQYQ